MNRMGRVNGQTKSNQASQFKTKGTLDLSQEHYLEETRKDLDKSHHSDSANLSSKATHTITAQIQQKDLEMVNDCMVEDGKEVSSNGSQQTTRQGKGNKLKNLHKTKAKGSNGLGVKGTKNLKGSRNLKHPVFSFRSKGELSQPLEGQKGGEQIENGRDVECSNPSAKNRLGFSVQEESNGDSRRGYSTNSCGTDRDSGFVQERAGASMEATFPHNSNEHQN